ncbi:MAG: hypothetical protein HYU41_12140 [Candidatus Rokubacteria bacterium]|nr:hypothetical protein [Candidatus Rokubacteria bacterium]
MTRGGARVAAVGLLTGFGDGLEALPGDAQVAAAGRDIVPIATPAAPGDRFRRATRECVLGVAAVDAALRNAGLSRADVCGSATALVYVTAAAYGASNRAFAGGAASRALHFPYTAPSAVPAEVAIEFGFTGAYVILIGGPTATLEALWHASALVGRGAAARALVVAIETFSECGDLYARGRRLLARPLVEAAACAVLVPAAEAPAWHDSTAGPLDALAQRRAGETLACGPLIALALAADDHGPVTVTGQWRGRRTGLAWRRRLE